MEGKGIYFYNNGEKFEGKWKDCKRIWVVIYFSKFLIEIYFIFY